MIVDIPVEIPSKKVRKLVEKNNKLINKGKENKSIGVLEDVCSACIKTLEDKPEGANIYLYLLSLITESYPEFVEEEDINIIFTYFDSGSQIKEQLNAISIIGFYILDIFEEKDLEEIDFKIIDQFLKLLENEETEIRHNICVFLDQFPEEEAMRNYYMAKLDFFLELLRAEENPEIMKSIIRVLEMVQDDMSLSGLIDYMKELSFLYSDSNWPEKNEQIRRLMEKEIPELKNSSSETSKRKILDVIENRKPLTRKYDVDQIAGQEEMKKELVKENLIAGSDDQDIYSFYYSQKHHDYFIEFEKKPLIEYFSDPSHKISVEKILKDFKPLGIDDTGVLAILIKGMVKNLLIKGFLSKNYWYPYEYLISQIKKELTHKNYIKLSKYRNLLNDRFLNEIMDYIASLDNYAGVYDKPKNKYYSLRGITNEIDKNSTSKNTIEMSKYKQKFGYEDFLKIEQYSKQFFTKFHKEHEWLTNLGKTRLEMYMRKASKIGMFSIPQASEDLEIPEKIIRDAIKGVFSKKNGFWNKNHSAFYYSKYIKSQIREIQNLKDMEKRNEKIDHLAEELNLDRDEISKKVDEKLHKIGKILKNKDEINIKKQLSNLQMEYDEFMDFVNSFGKPYLIVRDKIIFNPHKIEKEKKNIKEKVKNEIYRTNEVNISNLAKRDRCSSDLIANFVQELLDAGKIEGIWLDENIFLTRSGIENKILDSSTYIDLHSLVKERTLTPKEVEFVEDILNGLMERNQLQGIYDSETKTFTSNEMAGEVTLDKERERFVEEIQPYLNQLEFNYNFLQTILMNPDLTPSDINDYERIMEETMELVFNTKPVIQRLRNIINSNIRKMESPPTYTVKENGEEKEVPMDVDHDDVMSAMIENFENWKETMIAIEQKANTIIFLRKKLKSNPDDEERKRELNEILEYLGFI